MYGRDGCRSCWLSNSLIAIVPDVLSVWRFFCIRMARDCDYRNQQNIESLEEVMLMGNWR